MCLRVPGAEGADVGERAVLPKEGVPDGHLWVRIIVSRCLTLIVDFFGINERTHICRGAVLPKVSMDGSGSVDNIPPVVVTNHLAMVIDSQRPGERAAAKLTEICHCPIYPGKGVHLFARSVGEGSDDQPGVIDRCRD